MRLKITHRTEYRYDRPIAYALQRVRLLPRSGATQKVGSWSVTIEGAHEQVRFTDHFGNETRLISVEGAPRVIGIEATGEVETYNKAGVIGLHHGFAPLWLFMRETELTMPGDGAMALAAAVGEGADIARLHELMALMGEAPDPADGETPADADAVQALVQASGAGQSQTQESSAAQGEVRTVGTIRDQAEMFIAVARLLGFPARYVSGYLHPRWRGGESGEPRLGGSACRGTRLGRLRRRQFDVAGRDVCARDHRPRPSRRHGGVRNSLGAGRGTACRQHQPGAVIQRAPWRDSAGEPMTYCVGLRVDRGLVFMSDTRTNAGIDSISTFRKMHIWSEPGERVIVLMAAGNLATTQAVVSLLDERSKAVAERSPTLLETPSMYQTARLVGNTVKEVIANSAQDGQKAESYFNASFILGGQIRGTDPRLFMIYPEGNFIEFSDDTPFFQIGETKYGKPIIVRAYDRAMSFAEATKLLLVSFDSTLKSNLSVGLPLDLFFYEKDSLKPGLKKRIGQDDPYYRTISDGWSNALKNAFKSLPDFPET